MIGLAPSYQLPSTFPKTGQSSLQRAFSLVRSGEYSAAGYMSDFASTLKACNPGSDRAC